MEDTKGIKSWSPDDRPREKMMDKGPAALSDAELLAILISSGTAEESAVDIARKMLKSSHHDLHALGNYSLKQFTQFKGIGPVRAITIMAAMELGKRRRAVAAKAESKIIESRLAYERFLQYMMGLKHEEFWVMCLNNARHVLALKKISEGGLTATYVDPKKVFHLALQYNAASIIIAHNHPSGTLKPSRSDELLTKRLLDAGKLLECTLDDHLIVCDDNYFSFADEGLLHSL
ncbi:MAG TPA: DNA repair protein RadC [Flavobacteriales bacterium]